MEVVIVVFVLVVGFIVYQFVQMESRGKVHYEERQVRIDAIAQKYGLSDVIWSLGMIVGYESRQRRLLFYRSDDNMAYVPVAAIKTAELLVTTHEPGTTTSLTRTNRSSQLIRGAAGAAIAGPIGAVIGGLSASQETTTTAGRVATTTQLRLRLDSESLPFLSIVVDGGNWQAPEKLEARLQNAIERREDAVGSNGDDGSLDFGALVSAVLLVPTSDRLADRQKGWMDRTFGT